MSEKEKFMIICLKDLKNIERLFKGNEKVIKEQRDLAEWAINQYLQEKRKEA